MYDDYPTIYETVIDQYLIYFIILGIIIFLLLLITHVALAKIFKKANRSGISAWIPIYNIIVLLEITNSPKWYLLTLIIPGVNILFYAKLMFKLSKSFRKSKMFGFGLIILPFVFYPILASGFNEYIGINLEAMEGKTTVVEIPKIVEEEKKPVVNEQKDESLKNISISIGGGVYQKDYTNTLLQVDKEQKISTNFIENSPSIPNRLLNDNIDSSKLSFIAPIEEESKEREELPQGNMQGFVEKLNSISEAKQDIPEKNNPMREIKPIENINEMENNIEQAPSFRINPEIQSLSDSELRAKSEFTFCPKCGAKVTKDAKVCFLCGRKLD